jgi:hypothetical protein
MILSRRHDTAILIMIEGQLQVFQRFSGSKLELQDMMMSRCHVTADCKIIGTGPTVFNGLRYQFITGKPLKAVAKVSVILQSAVLPFS